MASSLSPVSGVVGPDVTKPEPGEVAVAVLTASIAAAPAAVDTLAYSTAAAPMSALPVALTVIVGRVPSPAVIGAVHTLSCVFSDAVTLVAFVYVLPAESVTPEMVALPELHTPAMTTRRFPPATADAGVSCKVVPVALRPETRWTNFGDGL